MKLPGLDYWTCFAKNTRISSVYHSIFRLLLFTAMVFFVASLQAQEAIPATYKHSSGEQVLQPDVIVGNPYKVKTALSQGFAKNVTTNPDLPSDIVCEQIRIVLILDESGSITEAQTPGAANQVRAGAMAMVNALNGSGAE